MTGLDDVAQGVEALVFDGITVDEGEGVVGAGGEAALPATEAGVDAPGDELVELAEEPRALPTNLGPGP